MKKVVGYSIIFIGFILVTFFGLGPVIFADGAKLERMVTLVGVVALYLVLIVALKYIRKTK